MHYPTSEADIVAKQIKRLRKDHRIGDLELAILMNTTKRGLKKQPSEDVLQAIEAVIKERKEAFATKAPKVAIHAVLGIEPEAFEIELNGRLVSYQPAFQRGLTRGSEALQIGNEIISDTKRLSAESMKQRLAAAILGDWNPALSAADIEAVLTDFVNTIKSHINQEEK